MGTKFLAADADGDGIADSGLWKLPIGSIDGLTYYVAVRMVDNNSAININTAWSNRDFSPNGIVFSQANANATYQYRYPCYYFPSSIETIGWSSPSSTKPTGREYGG